jgi:hypothetical protein
MDGSEILIQNWGKTDNYDVRPKPSTKAPP